MAAAAFGHLILLQVSELMQFTGSYRAWILCLSPSAIAIRDGFYAFSGMAILRTAASLMPLDMPLRFGIAEARVLLTLARRPNEPQIRPRRRKTRRKPETLEARSPNPFTHILRDVCLAVL
jgi:hypothetical protein